MKTGAIRRFLYLLAGFLIWLAPQVRAQPPHKPAKSAESVRLSLLNKRLSAVFPAGARIEARGHSVMAADESDAEETRVVVDNGKQRFVIMCTELFQDAGPDFAQGAHRYLAGFPDEYKPAKIQKAAFLRPGLSGFHLIPGRRDAKSAAILVEALLIKNSDGAAQTLDFYITPAGLPHLAEYQKAARQIGASMQAGPRRLNLAAHTVSIGENIKEKLWLDLPPRYLLTTQEGPDFTVYHIRKVSALGTPASQFGIYLGANPEGIEKGKDAPGMLFGKTVQWQQTTRSKGDLRFEQQVQAPHPHQSELTLHLFISAATAQERDAMLGIAATLRDSEAKPAKP